jgi:hypothetical protein
VRLLDLASRDALGSPGRVEPAVAREVARRMGAQVLIVPEIRRRGPELVIQVRALEPERQQLLFEAEERGPSSDRMEAIPEMVERLAASVRQELRGSSDAADRAPGSGTAVTRSLEAYRHYLLGQQFANETFDIPAAIAEYKRALAVDPDFAMPHLEMAILAGWHDAPDEDPLTHMQSAARQAGRLPDKERRLVLGYQAFVENRHRESARILDALVLDYPLDKQVLYVTGEAFWHSDTPAGFARGASHFRAALDLDPAYLVAYIHLFAWIDRFGPREEALARADRAAKFRPSPQAQAMVSRALGAAGRWTEALASRPERRVRIGRPPSLRVLLRVRRGSLRSWIPGRGGGGTAPMAPTWSRPRAAARGGRDSLHPAGGPGSRPRGARCLRRRRWRRCRSSVRHMGYDPDGPPGACRGKHGGSATRTPGAEVASSWRGPRR